LLELLADDRQNAFGIEYLKRINEETNEIKKMCVAPSFLIILTPI